MGWRIAEDSARGYRRIVPSPEPVDIIEIDAIRKCVEDGIIVVAVGGGGIPVVREDGNLKGVEAVIDKDLSSALLAFQLGLRQMIVSTDVDFVYMHYKEKNQRELNVLSLTQAKILLEQGVLPREACAPRLNPPSGSSSEGEKK